MRTLIRTTLLASVIFIAAASPRARAASVPAVDPVRLVNVAVENSARPYKGRMMVTNWVGKETTAQEVNVFYLPPDRYRFEFLTPEGKVQRIVVTDGQQQLIRPVRDGKEADGFLIRGGPTLLTREQQRRMLFDNYRVTVAGAESVIGRDAWILILNPISAGKPQQRWSVDKQTGIILELKKAVEGGSSNASSSRFIRFEPDAAASEDLFVISSGLQTSDNPTAVSPRLITIKELETMAGGALPIPIHLSGGFALESADFFKVKGEAVQHWRYTDGLVPLSLFETELPVQIPEGGIAAAGATSVNVPAYLGSSSGGTVRYWQSGAHHYTLIGDVSSDLLQQMDPDKP